MQNYIFRLKAAFLKSYIFFFLVHVLSALCYCDVAVLDVS